MGLCSLRAGFRTRSRVFANRRAYSSTDRITPTRRPLASTTYRSLCRLATGHLHVNPSMTRRLHSLSGTTCRGQLRPARPRTGAKQALGVTRRAQQVGGFHQASELVRGDGENVLRAPAPDHHRLAGRDDLAHQRRQLLPRPPVRCDRRHRSPKRYREAVRITLASVKTGM